MMIIIVIVVVLSIVMIAGAAIVVVTIAIMISGITKQDGAPSWVQAAIASAWRCRCSRSVPLLALFVPLTVALLCLKPSSPDPTRRVGKAAEPLNVGPAIETFARVGR